ncbi:MAG: chemotaxis-specific protein-glutamate methyltransferase CheB, partial [Pseudomonadota bacterium]
MSGPVSLLIVDDSATLRAVVKSVVRRDSRVEVVGEAATAMEARALIKSLDPDVITLDIEMPGMNGLDFLDKIMTLRPMPVIMLSGSTAKGSESAVTALSSGAFHCLAKPSSGNIIEALADLPDLIVAAAASPLARYRNGAQSIPSGSSRAPVVASTQPQPWLFRPNSIIAIGSSTGGVDALADVLDVFPTNCPPTLIAQHMPPAFIESFAQRLNRTIAPDVGVARDGESLKPGQIRFAPGGNIDLCLSNRAGYRARLAPHSAQMPYSPSADVLMASVAKAAGRSGIGAVLTGMGKDGARGLLAMRQAGAKTFAQDKASST